MQKKHKKGLSFSVSCLLKFTSEEHSKRCAFIYMENPNSDKINKAWAAFNMSGKVEDYLHFTALQNPPDFTEDKSDADCNRRSHNQI